MFKIFLTFLFGSFALSCCANAHTTPTPQNCHKAKAFFFFVADSAEVTSNQLVLHDPNQAVAYASIECHKNDMTILKKLTANWKENFAQHPPKISLAILPVAAKSTQDSQKLFPEGVYLSDPKWEKGDLIFKLTPTEKNHKPLVQQYFGETVVLGDALLGQLQN